MVIVLDKLVFGLRPHIGQLFNPSSISLSFELSYCVPTLLANFLNIPLQVLALAHIVEKANKCLDFAVTIFFWHMLTIWIVQGKFPSLFSWWLWQAAIITVTVLSSEYVCLKLETAEIKLDFGHIIEKGKEIGIKGAQKILDEGNKAIKATTSKKVSKTKNSKK